MTELLQKAFDRAAALPPEEQDAIATRLIDEIESESKWDDLFSRSQDLLEKMANEALTEHRRGLTEPLDPDNL
jgi:hypothetical protein